MHRDRNLLFGVFAVQLRKVSASDLMAAAGAWAADPNKDLPERLRETGAIAEADLQLLERLVQEAIAAHDGDASATLASFGGEAQVFASFGGSIVLTGDGGIGTIEPPTELGRTAHYLDAGQVPGVQETPGRYSHISEYGRGGMGRVLLVHDAFLGRDVALKELLQGPTLKDPSSPSTPVRKYMGVLTRFLQEARITGQLEHPSIVPVYELGHRSDGTLYYTMKLVRGRTLREALGECRTQRERLELLPHFVNLCQAIAYAHSRGIIHRDIKPGNVMVGEFGETVVLDWGLAKAKEREDFHADGLAETIRLLNLGDLGAAAKTQYGQVMGTPAYMPPEQAKGQLEAVDERSDVYSLGAVLYEILSGQSPFRGSVAEILHKVIVEDIPPIHHFDPDAPRELSAICQRSMQKNPEHRYQTVKELADDIQRFQSGALVRAHVYSARDLARRFVLRHRAVLATAAAALIIVFGLGMYYTLLLRSRNIELEAAQTTEREQRLAAQDAERTARQKEAEAVKATRAASQQAYFTALLLVQSYMAGGLTDLALDTLWKTDESQRGWEWSYLAAECYRDRQWRQSGTISCVSRSPDGRSVLVARGGPQAQVLDVNDGNTIVTLDGHTLGLTRAIYSPTGRLAATASWDRTARVWDAQTGQSLHELIGHKEAVVDVVFSPNEALIATASWDKTARVWNSETGAMLSVISGHSFILTGVCFSPDGKRIATSAYDGRTKVWDIETGRLLLDVLGGEGAGFSTDGKSLIACAEDGIHLFDAHTGANLDSFARGTGPLVGVVPSNEMVHAFYQPKPPSLEQLNIGLAGQRMTRASGLKPDILLGRWSGERNITLKAPALPANTSVYSGPLVAYTNCVQLPDLAEMRYDTVEFSDDGSRLVLSIPSFCEVWDARHGTRLYGVHVPYLGITSAELSRDGSQLAVAVDGKHVLVADLPNQSLQFEERGFSDIQQIAFTEDGAVLVAAASDQYSTFQRDGSGRREVSSEDAARVLGTRMETPTNSVEINGSTVIIRRTQTGDIVSTLQGHTQNVTSAVVMPDGRRVLTVCADSSAKVWDLETGTELVTLGPYDGSLRQIAIGPTGHQVLLVIAGAQNSLMWHAPPWLPTELPGSQAAPARERFEQYLVEHAVRQVDHSRNRRATVFVVTNATFLKYVFSMIEQRAGERSSGESSVVESSRTETTLSSNREWMHVVGINRDDVLTKVGDVSVEDVQTLRMAVSHGLEALERFNSGSTKDASNSPTISMEYSGSRGGTKLHFVLRPVTLEKGRGKVSRNHLRVLIQSALEAIQSSTPEELRNDLDRFCGERGVSFGSGVDPMIGPLLLQAGDFLTSINGHPLSNLESLNALLEAVRKELDSASSIRISGWRGPFIQFENELALTV